MTNKDVESTGSESNGSNRQSSMKLCEVDQTFQRYRMDSEFNSPTGKGKGALYEAIKLDLYRPRASCITFRTTEERMEYGLRPFIDVMLRNYPMV